MAEHTSRTFETGATRDTVDGKLRLEAYLSPLAIKRYGEYMRDHQRRPDGTTRSGDNWQKGIPQEAYVDSMVRHVLDVWLIHRGFEEEAVDADLEATLCAVLFNAFGLLHERVKSRVLGQRKAVKEMLGRPCETAELMAEAFDFLEARRRAQQDEVDTRADDPPMGDCLAPLDDHAAQIEYLIDSDGRV